MMWCRWSAERAATRLIPPATETRCSRRGPATPEAEPGWRERAAAMRIATRTQGPGDFARFTAAGRTEYRDWLTELAGNLAERLQPPVRLQA